MDTVYLRGMLAQQPFWIDGNRTYGLACADDEQGVALIVPALSVLEDFALTMVSSPSWSTVTKSQLGRFACDAHQARRRA